MDGLLISLTLVLVILALAYAAWVVLSHPHS
jgi:hypothetical protein